MRPFDSARSNIEAFSTSSSFFFFNSSLPNARRAQHTDSKVLDRRPSWSFEPNPREEVACVWGGGCLSGRLVLVLVGWLRCSSVPRSICLLRLVFLNINLLIRFVLVSTLPKSWWNQCMTSFQCSHSYYIYLWSCVWLWVFGWVWQMGVNTSGWGINDGEE